MDHRAGSTWTRAALIAVTIALCAACAEPTAPRPSIQDRIDGDANLG